MAQGLAQKRFNAAAHRAASTVIAEYSTSFSLATALLRPRVRQDIRTLYAMVRIADEIVDGAMGETNPTVIGAELDAFEDRVKTAINKPLDTDLVLHAFGDTARRCGISSEHIADFFASMRADITTTNHTSETLERYIYGSAEVIGLMCVAVFVADEAELEVERRELLDEGARRLGAGFQKVNFLRDIGQDTTELSRNYFASYGVNQDEGLRLTESAKQRIVQENTEDFAVARDAISHLPIGVRAGVLVALEVFAELNQKISDSSIDELYSQRLTVPNLHKSKHVARALWSLRRH